MGRVKSRKMWTLGHRSFARLLLLSLCTSMFIATVHCQSGASDSDSDSDNGGDSDGDGDSDSGSAGEDDDSDADSGSGSDSESDAPTDIPTNIPTDVPSFAPTFSPSDVPTNSPSDIPTIAPSFSPTDVPSDVPTNQPTDVPSDVPSAAPTSQPSDAPSDSPSDVPTTSPSDVPTTSPSDVPSDVPSVSPSDAPTDAPSDVPSDTPTQAPSDVPSHAPTTSTTTTVTTSTVTALEGTRTDFELDLTFDLDFSTTNLTALVDNVLDQFPDATGADAKEGSIIVTVFFSTEGDLATARSDCEALVFTSENGTTLDHTCNLVITVTLSPTTAAPTAAPTVSPTAAGASSDDDDSTLVTWRTVAVALIILLVLVILLVILFVRRVRTRSESKDLEAMRAVENDAMMQQGYSTSATELLGASKQRVQPTFSEEVRATTARFSSAGDNTVVERPTQTAWATPGGTTDTKGAKDKDGRGGGHPDPSGAAMMEKDLLDPAYDTPLMIDEYIVPDDDPVDRASPQQQPGIVVETDLDGGEEQQTGDSAVPGTANASMVALTPPRQGWLEETPQSAAYYTPADHLNGAKQGATASAAGGNGIGGKRGRVGPVEPMPLGALTPDTPITPRSATSPVRSPARGQFATMFEATEALNSAIGKALEALEDARSPTRPAVTPAAGGLSRRLDGVHEDTPQHLTEVSLPDILPGAVPDEDSV